MGAADAVPVGRRGELTVRLSAHPRGALWRRHAPVRTGRRRPAALGAADHRDRVDECGPAVGAARVRRRRAFLAAVPAAWSTGRPGRRARRGPARAARRCVGPVHVLHGAPENEHVSTAGRGSGRIHEAEEPGGRRPTGQSAASSRSKRSSAAAAAPLCSGSAALSPIGGPQSPDPRNRRIWALRAFGGASGGRGGSNAEAPSGHGGSPPSAGIAL